MRKIIQLLTKPALGDDPGIQHALCDDGTLWKLVGDKWIQKTLPKIPQDPPVLEYHRIVNPAKQF